MARITTYTIDGTITDDDKLLGTDAENANATKNYLVGDLATFITSDWVAPGSGTTDYIPLWTPDGNTLGDSIIFTKKGGLEIQVGVSASGAQTVLSAGSISTQSIGTVTATASGTLSVQGEANFDSNVTMGIGLTIGDFLIADGNIRLLGSTPFSSNKLTVNGNTELKGETRFSGKLLDAVGSAGTNNSILASTGAGTGVIWKNATEIPNNVYGSGTNLAATMWYGASPTSKLIDSPITFSIVDPGNLNDYGLQFGGLSTATGQRNSIAIGYDNKAQAEATLATGHGTTASGLHAASFNFDTTASGNKSAAFGSNTTASGTASFAIGNTTTAATSNAFAGGLNSTANPSLNGATAFAYGNTVNVTGEDAAGLGKNNTVSGRVSFAAGANNQAINQSTIAIGNGNIVSGVSGGAIGSSNVVSTTSSFAIGKDNNVGGSIETAAFGYDLTTGSKQYQVVVGHSNVTNNEADFVVGAGDGGGNKNGLEVYNDKVVIPEYGSGTVAGTAAYNLAVSATGKIIETPAPIAPLPYLSAVVLINQSGTNAPTNQNLLENSLGITAPFNWTYVSPGLYNLNAPGKFKLLKTIVFVNNGSESGKTHNVTWEVIDADNLRIGTHNSNNSLTKASLEIRTYN